MWPFKKREPEPEPRALVSPIVGMTAQPLVISSDRGAEYDEAWHRLLSIAGHVSRVLGNGEPADPRWASEHWPEATSYIGRLGMFIARMAPEFQAAEQERLDALAARLRRLGWKPPGVK